MNAARQKRLSVVIETYQDDLCEAPSNRFFSPHIIVVNGEINRRNGTCVRQRNEKKPCGLEAACRQLDTNAFYCVCPHDSSQPTDDLKCPKRITVPVAPKPFVNLSINKNEQRPLSTEIAPNTTVAPQSIRNTTFGPAQATTFFPAREMDISVLGVTLRINLLVLLAVGVALSVSVILMLVLCCVRCSKNKRKPAKKKDPVAPLIKSIIQDDCYALNPQYATPSIPAKDTILIPSVSKNCISSMVVIGQGYFGKVYKGFLRQTDGRSDTVAIKVLKDHANLEAKEDFMREVEIMTYFRHENILTLIGICPQGDKFSPWMIFEYMEYGDLTEVLRNSSEQFMNYSASLPLLDRDSLLLISLQISAGMKYLASQRFVHRDLACRNCLVGKDLCVKIADFGMSRDIYTCDYYKVGGSRLLPVRWMSPESVVYGKFTLESDVWSFGVVLWEIYSLGKQPYFGYSNDEVLKLIHDGILLDIPLNCPPVICVLMNGCWKGDPKERLRFVDIHERLKNAASKRLSAHADGNALPRPPALPAIVDHLSLRKMPSEDDDFLDGDNYLQPDDHPLAYDVVEYVTPHAY